MKCPRILTSKSALEGERKQVTVLFADLKGSLELLADRDPEEARGTSQVEARPSGSEGEKAVVLLSGGLDSATTLAIARSQGYVPYALSFAYGQRHGRELEAAKRVAAALGAKEHLVLSLDLRLIGGSALTADIPVPKGRSPQEIGAGIPVTYVPARNTIFLAHALGWAEVIGAEDIFFGANVYDFSGYPDCRPEYVEAFERMANLATKAGVEGKSRFKVHTPLIRMTKAEIIRTGHALGVDFGLTWSCYEPAPDGKACGLCDSCMLRKKGFAEAGLTDPLPYRG